MTDQPQTLRAALGSGLRLIGYFVRRHPGSFTLAAIGAAFFAGAIVASAVVIGRATDSVIVPVLDGGEPLDRRLVPAVLAVVAVATWKAAAIVLRRGGASYLFFANQADLRLGLIDRILRLELSWYRRQTVGDLLATTDTDTSQATFILNPLPYSTGASLLLIGSVVMIGLIDPWLALIALVSLGGLLTVDISGSWRTFETFQAVQEERGAVARVAHESFDGALTVKALGRQDTETTRFRTASEKLRALVADTGRIFSTYRVVVEGLLSVVTVVMLVAGTVRIRAGAVTPGEVITVAYLLSLLFIPIRIIGFMLWDMSHSVAAWRRVQRVMTADELVEYGSIESRMWPSGAEVDGVAIGFGYTPDQPILRDVHFTIGSGRVVAVVGPTGSGKSTLVTLLARLWDPGSGVISIDGADLRDFARSALPGEVAFVAQDAFLFDDTVRGNIAFGTAADDAAIRAAADVAGATGFIEQLPDGWDSMLGERGVTLSGGQRQRIALARALVRRPRLLILDDATSAVDPSVETRILERLKRAKLPATVVMVAYRRSSITLADEVVFVDDGRIVAHGTHRELLATVPGYVRILEAYERDAAARAATSEAG
ncbi:MAG: ABC transporter ATP-binding protein [Acidimicrobiia bacterium]|nr:ABC transporter ATP-binding protein [Acidimicrobiia bacterium]